MATLTVFSKFPELPLELRREIWKFAMPQPRVVELAWLSLHQIKPVAASARKPGGRPKYSSELAQVNREARDQYLREYKPILLVDLRAPDRLEGRPRLSSVLKYFNPEIDTLYISKTPSWHLLENTLSFICPQQSLEKLRFLAFSVWHARALYTRKTFDRFPDLEQVTIVTGDINWQHARLDGEVTFVRPKVRPARGEETTYSRIITRLHEDLEESHEWVFARSAEDIGNDAGYDTLEHKPLPQIERRDALRGGYEMSDP